MDSEVVDWGWHGREQEESDWGRVEGENAGRNRWDMGGHLEGNVETS